MPPRPANNLPLPATGRDPQQRAQNAAQSPSAERSRRQRLLEQARDANPATRRGVGKFGWPHPDGCACETCWPGLRPDRRQLDIVHVPGCRCELCHISRALKASMRRDAEAKQRSEAAAEEKRRKKEAEEEEMRLKKEIKAAETRLKKEAKERAAQRKKEAKKQGICSSCI